MNARRSRARGTLEREVMACLAAADSPMTAAQVQAELGEELAYTTVMTTLTRLHAKHALVRSARGRAFAYELVGGTAGARASVTAHHMHKLLESGTDRADVLSHFVDRLDGDSERVLRSLLNEADRPDAT
jgi:predicted transcriptional regulator